MPANSKAKSLQDLIAAGKSGELTVGTYATGYSLFTHLFAQESGETRNPEQPDVPTVREAGLPGYAAYTWVAFFMRAAVPDPYADRIAAAMQKVLDTQEARDFARKHGAEQMPHGPEALGRFLRSEYDRLRGIAQAAGIKPE